MHYTFISKFYFKYNRLGSLLLKNNEVEAAIDNL